jgi:hypothetical protein
MLAETEFAPGKRGGEQGAADPRAKVGQAVGCHRVSRDGARGCMAYGALSSKRNG